MKLIILDRDGVINEDSDEYIKSPDEFIPIAGSLEAISRLNHAGYTVMVATNQSGLARGYFSIEDLNNMHDKLRRLLSATGGRINGILFCPHGPDDHCDCRKPKPGMLLEIAQRLDISLDGVPAVGDSLRDLQAALAVGAQPVLVRTGKGTRTIDAISRMTDQPELSSIPVYDNLSDYVDDLLEKVEQ
jgi:D-glycero-D-manno-heptose 1,7-bisphosphate phosphatase